MVVLPSIRIIIVPIAIARQLLFHRIRPVFVFDGGTPALKRKTVMTRKQRRENQVGLEVESW